MCNGNCHQGRTCDCAESVVNVLWAFSVIGLSGCDYRGWLWDWNDCGGDCMNADTLESLLRDCREKLSLYRAEHSGVYLGGVEYTTLLSRIDAALATGGWMPIETAPRDGSHIIGTNKTSCVGFGFIAGTQQPWQCVVHWFNDGFYASVYGADQEEPFTFLTHWRPLPSLPKEPK